jgi:GrpB-like predicted nucleotidyltransferase (UPF0157 family)
MIGLKRGMVKLVPHDGRWAALFEKEKFLFEDAFQETIIAIEHIGSTAIPGIPAKPIIDINIGVESLEVARAMKPIFVKLGYEHRPFVAGNTVEGLLAQELYVRGPESRRTHYVHVTVYGSDHWNNYVLLRDYLRRNAERAEEYANLKIRLAQEYPNDRGAYTRNKEQFVLETLEIAKMSERQ